MLKCVSKYSQTCLQYQVPIVFELWWEMFEWKTYNIFFCLLIFLQSLFVKIWIFVFLPKLWQNIFVWRRYLLQIFRQLFDFWIDLHLKKFELSSLSLPPHVLNCKRMQFSRRQIIKEEEMGVEINVNCANFWKRRWFQRR